MYVQCVHVCLCASCFMDHFDVVSLFGQKFVTRAIRIMEWIANMDLSGYQNQSGLTAIINRLEVVQSASNCIKLQ